ncbi:MAG TPA: hypothetical protein VE913_08570 [Longimicrobium sp.]|nr:hypothetical protein [Longimicrobium sp.]
MKAGTLLFLRLTIAYLLVIWGVDKLVNPEHGLAVSRTFYAGLFGGRSLMPAYGALQIALGALLALGIGRRFVYPAVAAITGTTLLGVWRSVADPWGWYLEGSNVLFYPSAVVFAAVLVLWAWRDDDLLAAGRRRVAAKAHLHPDPPR